MPVVLRKSLLVETVRGHLRNQTLWYCITMHLLQIRFHSFETWSGYPMDRAKPLVSRPWAGARNRLARAELATLPKILCNAIQKSTGWPKEANHPHPMSVLSSTRLVPRSHARVIMAVKRSSFCRYLRVASASLGRVVVEPISEDNSFQSLLPMEPAHIGNRM